LMDDRAGRSAAIHCGLAVVGTADLLEQAAALNCQAPLPAFGRRTPALILN
jgi:predicted nucleic acid-binding protein